MKCDGGQLRGSDFTGNGPRFIPHSEGIPTRRTAKLGTRSGVTTSAVDYAWEFTSKENLSRKLRGPLSEPI